MSVLRLERVCRYYESTPPVKALHEVDLEIEAGEMLAIVGPSGSGKSTLLNVMGTLDRPTSGRVWVDGEETSDMSDGALSGLRSSQLGFVFQGFHLMETVGIVDNVATGLLYQAVPKRQRRDRAAAALTKVGLGDRLDARPTQLSGGQRQRVAIARAIVADPALVLADEPTGNLDSSTSRDIMELFANLNQAGATIVVITHDNELADQLPRTVAMSDGQIVADRVKAISQAAGGVS